MGELYVVRDKRTLKVLATYDSVTALCVDWFTRVGDHWEPKAEIVAVTQGSIADELFAYMEGQGDTEAGE